MSKDQPGASCQLCSDGLVVAVVPAGPCKGLGVCEKCDLALRESTPRADVEAPPRRHNVVELRPAPAAYETVCLATGSASALAVLIEALPPPLDFGELRVLSVLPDRALVPLWHALSAGTVAELLAGLRSAAAEAGIDLRLASELVQSERRDESARSAGAV